MQYKAWPCDCIIHGMYLWRQRWPFRTLHPGFLVINVVYSHLMLQRQINCAWKWHGIYLIIRLSRLISEYTLAVWNCIEWKYKPSVWINKSQENKVKDKRHVSVTYLTYPRRYPPGVAIVFLDICRQQSFGHYTAKYGYIHHQPDCTLNI